MRETYWGYWLVILGIFIIGVMLLVNNISTTSTQDYYSIKEVTQASMIDAVDFSYYRLYGNLKISEQKFVENFVRRFAENVNMSNTYDVDFYDLFEVPPKVSVKISTGSNTYRIADTSNAYDVTTTISSILELSPQGESTPESNKAVTKQDCMLNLSTELRRYFKGETVNGYTYAADQRAGIMPNLSDEQKNSLAACKDFNEFNKWFNTKFTVNGTPAGEYLHNTKDYSFNQLDASIRTFIERGWMIKH